jgi:hypothetical protein
MSAICAVPSLAYQRGGVPISREEAKIDILEAVGGAFRVVGVEPANVGRVMLAYSRLRSQ